MADEAKILVVDLDGTLLQSDMLHENFWSAFASDWRTPFIALRALLQKGRAGLKARLAQMKRPEISILPYNEEVLAFVRNWQADGGQVILATGTNEVLANEIAAHLGVFDDVFGSDGTTNLTGKPKAELLSARYEAGAFAYMGDSAADLPVWAMAQKAITVNVSPALSKRAGKVAEHVENLGARPRLGWAHLKALRPHQWLKNILIFLPMFVAHQLDIVTFTATLLGFIAFSLVASGVYVLNDLLDLSVDRAHPRKRSRPFASGAVPIAHGGIMAMGLCGAGLLFALIVGPVFAAVLCVYFILTTAYSLWLKRLVLIDICVLAGLYTVRIVAGGAATGIMLSEWLLALSMFFFLSLAAVKRQAELVDAKAGSSAYGRDYRAEDLPFVSMVALSAGMVSVLITALYINSDAVQLLYKTPETLWVICVVLLYWLMRAVLIAHRGEMHDDPVVFAAKDKVSHVCAAVIFAAAVIGNLV